MEILQSTESSICIFSMSEEGIGFMLKIQKPKRPFAVFTDKEKAIKWCRQFVKK